MKCLFSKAFRAAVLLLAVLAAISAQGQAVKRLILTDGSYQLASEWSRNGDRVRYLSAERGEWEELPASLVDWKATEEWNAQSAKSAEEEMKQVTEEEVAARKQAELNTPMVAPELRLPAEGGVFLFEESPKPALQKLEGSHIEVNEHAGKTMLKRSINPIAAQVQTIELQGPSAKVRVRSAAPSLFVDVENDLGVIAGDNFRLVRLERKKDLRVVAKHSAGISGEKTSEKYLHTRAEKFSGDWYKIVVLEDLAPGEYALVVAGAGDDAYGAAWDFGVDK
jgi:hypothetical protein